MKSLYEEAKKLGFPTDFPAESRAERRRILKAAIKERKQKKIVSSPKRRFIGAKAA